MAVCDLNHGCRIWRQTAEPLVAAASAKVPSHGSVIDVTAWLLIKASFFIKGGKAPYDEMVMEIR